MVKDKKELDLTKLQAEDKPKSLPYPAQPELGVFEVGKGDRPNEKMEVTVVDPNFFRVFFYDENGMNRHGPYRFGRGEWLPKAKQWELKRIK